MKIRGGRQETCGGNHFIAKLGDIGPYISVIISYACTIKRIHKLNER